MINKLHLSVDLAALYKQVPHLDHPAACRVHLLPLKDRVHQHRQAHNHQQQAQQARLAQHLDHPAALPVHLPPLKDRVRQHRQ